MPDVSHPRQEFCCAPLGRRWKRVEREKTTLLKSVCEWREGEAAWKPSDGEWCAAQVLDHLVLTEEAIFREMQKVSPGERGRPTRWERFRFFLLERAFRTSVRVRVPSAVKFLLPPAESRLEDALARWETLRIQMEDFLRLQDCAASKRTAMRHPVAGDLSLESAVAFMLSHMIHHNHQLRRIRRRLPSTKIVR